MKKRGKTKRLRRVEPLHTESGNAEVERTREYLAGLVGEKFLYPEWMGQIEPSFMWTARLPGFKDAWQSACNAWTIVKAESEFWREIASAKNDTEREVILGLAQVRARTASVGQVLTAIENCPGAGETGSRLLRKFTEAKKAEEKANNSYQAFIAAQATADKVPLSSYEPSMLINRKANMARSICVSGWVTLGFWLAGAANILAFLAQAKERCAEFAELDLPDDPQTVSHWISDLGLSSYRGKGSLFYDQKGRDRPDRPLLAELGHTHPNYEMLAAYGEAYEIGNCIVWECRDKAGSVKDLEQ